MTLAEVVLAVMWVGLTAYAVLGGADFGAGFWDLFAGSATRGARQRDLIAAVIGPVWEVNHVWIIFCLVVLWTAFSAAFGAIMSTLYIPLTLVTFGIILRGSGFAFRKVATTVELRRIWGATFAMSSVVTPFFLGAVAGGVASGRVPLGDDAGDALTSWLNPTSVLGGLLAVGTCAFLAATFLTREAHHRGEEALAAGFRLRAIGAGFATGAVALVGIFVLRADAPELFDGLTGRALPVVVVSGLAGSGAIVLLWKRRYVVARLAAATAVAAVLWGWAVGQYPHVLEPDVEIADVAAPRATLEALLVVLVVGAAFLVPSLLWLYRLTEEGTLGETGPEPQT